MTQYTISTLTKEHDRPFLISESTLEDFARGAAFLGTGGGGDPYIGRLMAQNAIREFGAPQIIDPVDLADDATVAIIAMLGAPTVLNEKAAAGDDIDLAINRLSKCIGRPIDALIPAEIGGVNSTLPIVACARTGLPLVNADGMGRAFPEIQMVVMNFEGIAATPFITVDEHLNTVIIETDNAKSAEDFVRTNAIHMGLSTIVAGYPMTGADVKRGTIHGTLDIAYKIGQAISAGRRTGDPIAAIVNVLTETPTYGYACEVFDGKIIDLSRQTTGGFSIGECTIQNLTDHSRKMTLQFQNEHLLALENGQVRAIVPDLISVVDRETAEPIPVEALRYGQRVKVIAAAAPALLKTPQALHHVSPKNFGLDYEFTTIQALSRKNHLSNNCNSPT